MTRERRAEFAAMALAAGAGDVDVPAKELLGLLGKFELLDQRARLDSRGGRVADQLAYLEPYVHRAAKSLEEARGIVRQMHAIDEQLADQDDDELREAADRQYRDTCADIAQHTEEGCR